ncbi:MAG: glycosyltransferase family 1 protein [Novosphingobium sp.]|uniref:glycosyltransferase family 4 protein n=1 Tax=Novosphingobium sp. TaxID=1874826 RepID=UPI0012C806EB|nr:glycosyltransferase family 1 protein [Novosphingobium sp.]MPS68633.1 glycosyltransferase family 1 protein [Novosphingobium sp.]
MASIDINGKFLGAGLNGVHRTAAHYCEQLIKRTAGEHDVRLLSPYAAASAAEFAHLTPTQARGRCGSGQGWEMLTLPKLARGNLLVNFCNLAPLLHGNSVVMIHDAQTFLYPQDYSGRQAAAYRRMLPWIGRRARRILTVSAFARDALAAHGIGHHDKIDVVHNGTDHLLGVPADSTILQRLGLQSGRFVLTMGSIKGYKNMRSLFRAMHQPLPEGYRFVVAGGPSGDRYSMAGWTPPPGTVFTGFVSDAELRALYSAASVFVFPSLTEGFGLPPVEAMHCRTPVVAARAGAMPEVCEGAAVLVDAEDPSAYRQAISAILDDPMLADDFRARGARRAAALTWDTAGERLHSLISGLV